MLIFDPESQDTHAGGSGCGCSAVTLAAYLLPKINPQFAPISIYWHELSMAY